MTRSSLGQRLRRAGLVPAGRRVPAWLDGEAFVRASDASPGASTTDPTHSRLAIPENSKPPANDDHRGIPLSIGLRIIAAGPLVVLLALWAVFAVLSPYFFTPSNLMNVLVQSCTIGLLALGALVVVMVGSLDISLGATVSLGTIVAAVLYRDIPALGGWIVLAVLATGIAIGAINSFIVVGLRIGNAFIVTLGMMYVVQSFSLVASGGSQVPRVPEVLTTVANGNVLGIPGPILLVLAVGGLLAFFLNRVAWGRWIVAIGGNPDAAQKVGIPVRKVMFSVYIIASGFAAIAAMLVAGLNNAGTVDPGGTSILLAIAAVVIGGASLAGGRGSVGSTLVGAVILASVTNGLALLSVSPNWTPFAVGAVLVIAVILDALRHRLEGRLRVRQARLQGAAA